MNVDPHDILIRPLLTEKVTSLREVKNCVAFLVKKEATRLDVQRAVEKVLKVKVKHVNVMNVKGKKKRQGRYVGKRPDWRKAIVTLKEGEKLELYESA
ncbi:MAG: 50S ribosomal protein L23 [Nitrospirota bacterium]|nr:MAG: 50S ribosomal protein L23 [Nitrospirota bacterium]